MKIVRWFLYSSIFKILIAFVIDSVIFGEILFTISKILFSFIKKNRYKMYLCIGACMISAGLCLQYSKWGLLVVVIVWACSAFIAKTEKDVMSNVDNVKYSINKNFHIAVLEAWGNLIIFAILGPALLCLNSIVCKYYNITVIGWFRFYWIFDKGIFQYGIIRYAFALAPFIILILVYGALSEVKTKEWLVDLEEVRKKEIEKEKREAERILQMNPDSDVASYKDAESKVNRSTGEKHTDEEEGTLDSILNDISKFV